jgi:transcriptional regulator with XRE-family HTH domain
VTWLSFLRPRSDEVTPAEVRGLRVARGWTVEQLADDVHASPLEVSAWEAGTVQVPAFPAARVRWHLEMDRWNAALAAALCENPPCDWMRANLPHLQERAFVDSAGATWAHNREFREHFPGCAYCRARWQAAEAVGNPPREPDADSIERRTQYDAWLEFLPRWARRPARALLGFADLALLALLIATIPDADSGLPARITGLGIGTLAGIGFFRLTRYALSGLADRHPYLAGLCAGAVASVVGSLLWRFYDASVHLSDPRLWMGAAAVATAVGLISGTRARREAASEPPLLQDGASPDRPVLRNPEHDLPERDTAKVPTIIIPRM